MNGMNQRGSVIVLTPEKYRGDTGVVGELEGQGWRPDTSEVAVQGPGGGLSGPKPKQDRCGAGPISSVVQGLLPGPHEGPLDTPQWHQHWSKQMLSERRIRRHLGSGRPWSCLGRGPQRGVLLRGPLGNATHSDDGV